MTSNPTDDPPRYDGWRINLAATALVVATLLIGYGLAHLRDIPLPFGVDAMAKTRTEQSATRESTSARDADDRNARSRAR